MERGRFAVRLEKKDVAHTRYAGNRIRDGIKARYAGLYVLWGWANASVRTNVPRDPS